MAGAKKNRISVLNWMGTLLVFAIPGVNILAMILFLIFAKSASKKTYVLALLLWTLILAVAAVTLLLVFPEQSALLADVLRDYAANGIDALLPAAAGA